MKKLIVGGIVACAVVALRTSAFAGGILGSPHDFTGETTWNSRAGACSPCHAAHHTDEDQIAPLWVHATDPRTSWEMYDSPTMDATVGTAPSGNSLACLSCHDGALGINATISTPAPASPVIIDAGARIGENGDLHTTHPISFDYDAAAALDMGLELSSYVIGDAKDGLDARHKGMSAEGLVAPVPATWSGTSLTGQTIADALLIGGKMECSSCHDVHKLEGASPSSGILARLSGSDVNGNGSILCRTCHIK
ncbi:MAG: hypothetical protein K8T26_13470 [Lentisphaerae bacterium]|nr:hypothetical protein [Lentisphaerota bacterium]